MKDHQPTSQRTPVSNVEASIDLAIMDSFPASDPPPWAAPPPARVASEMFRDIGQHLRDDVRHLRNHGSDAVAQRFANAGLHVKRRPAKSANVEAVIQGGELASESIVIGASDATGIAVLLTVGRLLQDAPLDRTIRLVAFSSASLYIDDVLKSGPHVKAMVNVSVVGRPSLSFIGHRTLKDRAETAFEREPLETSRPWLFARRAAHRAFTARNIPSLTITDSAPLWPFGSAKAPDYDRLGQIARSVMLLSRDLARKNS